MVKSSKENYAGNPVVKVRIVSLKSSHVTVRLEDGSRGIIPRREWSWDRSEKPDTSKWVENSSHEAVLLPETSQAGWALLSFRQKTDPWEGTESWLKAGKVITGEVVNILSDSVYVQLKPGIDAFCAAADLPLFPDALPKDVLSYGDQLRAIITRVDAENRQVDISVNDWMRQIDIRASEQETRLERLFRKKINAATDLPLNTFAAPQEKDETSYEVPALQQLQSVLIVDDNPAALAIIKDMLQPLQVHITEITNGDDAIKWFDEGQLADLIIMDINLGDHTFGPEIAAQILEKRPDQHFLFTSRDPHNLLSFKFLEEKYNRKFSFFVKTDKVNDDHFLETIHLLQTGIVHKSKSMVARNQEGFIEQLEMQGFVKSSLKTGLEQMLSDLRRSIFVQHAFILEYDEAHRLFELTAAAHTNRPDLYEIELEKLSYSPAVGVIEEEDVLYVNDINHETKNNRFRNFYAHLDFKVVYAVPIKLPGYATRHGLFVLNNTSDLTGEAILQIRTVANFCAILIERDFILRKMQMYEDRYFKGQLFGTFMHELGNYMTGLQTSIKNVHHFGLEKPNPEKLQRGIDGLSASCNDIKELNDSYTRLMRDEIEYIDINEVVKKVKRQLTYKAQEENSVELLLDLYPDIPKVRANPLRVEQVVSNLVLNAIQHVSLQFKHMKEINDTRKSEQPLLVTKAVLVKTTFNEQKGTCHIFVLDTGPGVRHEQQHKVFRAGETSRRDGQGLGLFISKNLVEAMSGEIALVDSIRFCGSVFGFYLPIGPSKA